MPTCKTCGEPTNRSNYLCDVCLTTKTRALDLGNIKRFPSYQAYIDYIKAEKAAQAEGGSSVGEKTGATNP